MQTRNTLLMAAVLVLLGVFVYFYEIRGRETRETAEREASRLLSFEPTDARRLTVETADETVVVERQPTTTSATEDTQPEDDPTEDDATADGAEVRGGVWRIVEPLDLPADAAAIDSLLDRASRAEHEHMVTDSPDDLAIFGLQDPELRIALELKDGSSKSLELGGEAPIGSSVYAKRGDEPNIYMAGGGLKSGLKKTLFDLRDKKLLQFDESDIYRLEIATPGLQATVERASGSDAAVGDGWQITQPILGRADSDTIDDLLSDLHSEEAESFVLEEADASGLEQHGLQAPRIVLTLWSGESAQQRLMIGSESDDPEGFYARREDSSTVFVVPESLVDDLPDRLDRLRNRSVVDLQRDQIVNLAIADTAGTLRLEKPATEWQLTEPLMLEADSSAVSMLLSNLIDLRAEGFANDDDANRGGLENPLFTITVGRRAEADDAGERASLAPVVLRFGNQTRIVPLSDPTSTSENEPEMVDAYPVSASGDPTIYLVGVDDVDDLRPELFDLRSKTLVSFTQSELTSLEIRTPGSDSYSDSYAFEKTGDAWNLTSPTDLSWDPGDTNPVADLLWDLNYLSMETVEVEWRAGEPTPDLTVYGLGANAFRIIGRIQGDVVANLALGASVPASEIDNEDEFAPDEQVYITVSGGNGVYRVRGSLSEGVRELVEELRSLQ